MLLSGGLDSVAALAWARREGYTVEAALSYAYGQRRAREIESAAAVAVYYGVPHQVVALAPVRGPRPTDLGDMPLGRDLSGPAEAAAQKDVPNRTMIMLASAAAHALLGEAAALIGGWSAADAPSCPDCREPFLAAAEQTLRLATGREFRILRPLIDDGKPAVVRRALELGAPVELTWTCELGERTACGACGACRLRVAAFRQIGVIDPVPYAQPVDWSGCEPYRGRASL
jgi:7-cyano-7-deazaguanine synthase